MNELIRGLATGSKPSGMSVHGDGRWANQSPLSRHALSCKGCRIALFTRVIAEHHPRAGIIQPS